MKLEYPTHDGKHVVRVMHGHDCVAIQIATADLRGLGVPYAVLTAKEAAALGRRLIQQAKASHHEGLVDE